MLPPFGNEMNRDRGMQTPLGAPPSNPPPRPTMQRGGMTRAVDPGSIRSCIGRFTYIWLDHGEGFWMYPLQVGRRSVAGFRWTRFGWAYMGISLDRIDMFTCI
jgi:hypothetical protein